ncbi:MAG: Rrf2 family transcriptional regulator [Deltaproteobacteria bacterium]|nr:Rrf2 family transcriptional regulator [Deltaproteobacteria bacterium]
MLSKRAKYGLKALLMLADRYGQGPTLNADIARTEHIPAKFLELILLALKREGLVSSRKGRHGGYQLAKPPQEITVGRAVRVLDGPQAPLPCVSRTAYERCEECHDEAACALRLVMEEAFQASARILDTTTLADLLQRSRTAGKLPKGVLNYAI